MTRRRLTIGSSALANARRDDGPITAERIERALDVMAGIVVKYGEKYLPIYEALENDLQAARATESRMAAVRERFTQSQARRPA